MNNNASPVAVDRVEWIVHTVLRQTQIAEGVSSIVLHHRAIEGIAEAYHRVE